MNPAFKKFDLTGKKALITGGATGMGLEMTRALAQSGAEVMIAARRENLLKDTVEQLMTDPFIDSVTYHPVDLADAKSVKALTNHIASEWGGVDILIGNAGMEVPEHIEDITDDAVHRQMRVNLYSNIELTRDLFPSMKKNNWGRIIYCSSAISQFGTAQDRAGVYGAAKSGLNGFVKTLAAEGGRYGITANTLIIGLFMTDMIVEHLEALGEDGRKMFMDGLPSMGCVGRGGDPEEIAGLVQLLSSDAGSYLTGTCIPVDGGATSMLRPNPVEF